MALALEGKTALVTGAARGIGHAYCRRLAADGANVVAVDIAPADNLAELPGDGVKMELACDVGRPEQIRAAADTVIERFGRCDILVNNAAIFPRTELDGMTVELWRKVQAVNVEAVLLFAQALSPGMRAAGWGRIVNTGSGVTLLPVRDLAYLTSKGSVHALTRALANELGDSGITVNAIAPSVVPTEGFMGRARGDGPTAEDVIARTVSTQTVKRPSVPDDLGDALGFLVSDRAGFITGQILHVDGGATRTGA
ncbi:SDR family oxidoreductase [Streptomyces sp. DW26H14]|uniref:SDR family oxidoreductase n=1 Tax=Streptomyces sp. DW26H14 TaxID=3435395 RepID=UPI00403D7FF9